MALSGSGTTRKGVTTMPVTTATRRVYGCGDDSDPMYQHSQIAKATSRNLCAHPRQQQFRRACTTRDRAAL